jgi:hypothetical protein
MAMGNSDWLARQFDWNERLGIAVPALTRDWRDMSRSQQTSVLAVWETIRGTIPDHVKRFEEQIKVKQDELFEEDNFAVSCRLNGDIAELASRINDLHIWFRTQQDLEEATRRHG